MKNNSRADQRSPVQKLESLGQFSGGIAHDFNNLLSIIEGHTHLAVRQLKEGTLTPGHLQKILKSTQRGAGLTRRLLSFGREKSPEEKTDLAETLRQTLALLRPVLGETIRIFLTVPETPVRVRASEDLLTQVIINLSLNARDAMPQGGEISILCVRCQERHIPCRLAEKYPQRAFARLSVVDTGGGIPDSVLPRIFEPLFTTKGAGKGTGLGLSVVYNIVEQLGGCIEVSSGAGQGTSFDIYLPLAEGDILNPPVRLAGKTIMVAEDEPELRMLLKDMFNLMQMHVLSARNGSHAMVMQDEYGGKIDFLLADVVMPVMGGIRLGKMFKTVRPEASVVYMSGVGIQAPEDELFLSKPLEEDKVLQVLERALERRKTRLDE